MNDEQRQLLIQAKLDAQTAEECLKTGQLRAACSRGYYSMFYVVRAILLQDSLEFSKHSGVISAFGKKAKGDPKVPTALHKEMLFAFKRRGDADYDFHVSVSPDDVRRIVNSAHEFIELGEKLIGHVSSEGE